MKKMIFPIIICLLCFACSEEKLKPKMADEKYQGEIPAHESWNSKIYFSDDGKLKALLTTSYLKKYEIQKVTSLDGVRIDFYNKVQQKTSFLTSLKGRVDDATKDMYAIDNVVAENDSGTVLKTSELMWRNKDQKIISDKFVSIKSRKEIIEGYGMESDQDLRNYVIFNVTYSATVSNEQKK
jgi:LPS export ABC transporter protein LptC